MGISQAQPVSAVAAFLRQLSGSIGPDSLFTSVGCEELPKVVSDGNDMVVGIDKEQKLFSCLDETFTCGGRKVHLVFLVSN